MNLEAFVKEQIKEQQFNEDLSNKIEENISNENYLHCFLFGQYLYYWREFDKTKAIGDKVDKYLNLAYSQWPEISKNDNTYAFLNKLLLKFYFKYNKFYDAQTFIVNYFDTIGEDFVKEAWPWRYRFKILSEINLPIVVKNIDNYLKWLENAYSIEKQSGESKISINVLIDFLNRCRNIPSFLSFCDQIKNRSFELIRENENIFERDDGEYVLEEPKYEDQVEKQRNTLEALEKKINELENIISKKNNEIAKLNSLIENLKNDSEAISELSVTDSLIPRSERSLERKISVNSIGVIGDSRLNENKIKGIIKRIMNDNEIEPPQNKFIQIIASEYTKSKKSNLKKDIENNKFDWLIIAAHPHKLNNFSGNLETFIDDAHLSGYCSTKYVQCIDSRGQLVAINKSNLERAVGDLVMKEKSIE